MCTIATAAKCSWHMHKFIDRSTYRIYYVNAEFFVCVYYNAPKRNMTILSDVSGAGRNTVHHGEWKFKQLQQQQQQQQKLSPKPKRLNKYVHEVWTNRFMPSLWPASCITVAAHCHLSAVVFISNIEQFRVRKRQTTRIIIIFMRRLSTIMTCRCWGNEHSIILFSFAPAVAHSQSHRRSNKFMSNGTDWG